MPEAATGQAEGEPHRDTSTARWAAFPAPVHVDIAPDGSRLVLTTTEVPVGSDEELLRLWTLDPSTGAIEPVAAALPGDHTAVWSPDGTRLAFLTVRTGRQQVAVSGVDVLEPRLVTSLPGGATGPASWSPDGRLVVAGKRGRTIDRTRPWRVTRAVQWGDGLGHLDDPPQLWIIDPEGGEQRMITDDEWRWSLPRWSPDGTRIAARASFDPSGARRGQHLRILDPATGDWTAPEVPGGFAVVPQWCADGSLLALSFQPEGRPGGSEAQLHRVATDGRVERLDPACPVPVGGTVYGDSPAAVGDGFETALTVHGDDLFVRTHRGGRMGVAHSDAPTGGWTEMITGDRCATPLGVTAAGMLVAEQSAGHPCRLAVVTEGGDLRELHLPADTLPPRPAEVHRWTVPSPSDGTPLEVWHLRPPGALGALPTVLIIHGGPNAAFGECFQFDAQALCSAGFGVLYTNPHGSTGYGDDFTHAVFDDWGGAPAADELAVVDDAVGRGLADPDRLGVAGNSYGGYLTTWLACTTRRFRAAVAENPVTDLVSMFGTSDIGVTFLPMQFGASPLDDVGPYLRWSPLFRAADCHTPMLFVTGTDDHRCPPTQAFEMHRTLRALGRTSEVLVLPDSSHEGSTFGPPPVRFAHDQALIDWMARWLLDD